MVFAGAFFVADGGVAASAAGHAVVRNKLPTTRPTARRDFIDLSGGRRADERGILELTGLVDHRFHGSARIKDDPVDHKKHKKLKKLLSF